MPTIVLGTDLSDNAATAARWAFGIARTIHSADDPARLVVAHIVPSDEMQLRQTIADHSEDKEQEEIRRQIEQWLENEEIDTTDVDYGINISIGRKAKTLAHLCENADAHWLIVGKSGRGRLAKFFLGSTAEDLALRPPCPLLIVDPDDEPLDGPLRVVSAFDLTNSAAEAFLLGADLVELHEQGGNVTLLHVISIPHGASPIIEGHAMPATLEAHLDASTQWARDEITALLNRRGESLDAISASVEIRPGYPIHEIVATAEETQANLLTLGSSGRSRLTDVMLGGVGRSVLRRAPCSVLLAPPEPKTTADDLDDE